MTQSKTVATEAPVLAGRWALVVLGEGVVGLRRLPCEGEVIIGRGPGADVSLGHPSLSRRHIRLRIGAQLTVEDLGSRHGTVVAGRSLPAGETRALAAGDMLQLGGVAMGLVRAG